MQTEYTLLQPARTLTEAAATLLKRPLETQEQLEAFYSEKYGRARGKSKKEAQQNAAEMALAALQAEPGDS